MATIDAPASRRGERDRGDPAQPVEAQREQHEQRRAARGAPDDALDPGRKDPAAGRPDVPAPAPEHEQQQTDEQQPHEDAQLRVRPFDHTLEARPERVAQVHEHRSVTLDDPRRVELERVHLVGCGCAVQGERAEHEDGRAHAQQCDESGAGRRSPAGPGRRHDHEHEPRPHDERRGLAGQRADREERAGDQGQAGGGDRPDPRPQPDDREHEEREEVGAALTADRVERERRHDERGGRRVHDDGAPVAEQDDEPGHRGQRHHGHDVLDEVDRGDGGPIADDRAQRLAREPPSHEAVPVRDVPERPPVLAQPVAGVREPLRDLVGDAHRERDPDRELEPCGREGAPDPGVIVGRRGDRVARHGGEHGRVPRRCPRGTLLGSVQAATSCIVRWISSNSS